MWGDRSSCFVNPRKDLPRFLAQAEKKRVEHGLDSLWFINQELHTPYGYIVAGDLPTGTHLAPKDFGDFLITDKAAVGIAVSTADCLPIVFFDPIKQVLAVIHAGWKGSVQGIAVVALRQLIQNFGVDPTTLLVWFGPHARSCCYEVSEDFAGNLFAQFVPQAIALRGTTYFFSNGLYTRLLLEHAGIPRENISEEAALCTMCQGNFHSRRNDGPEYIGQSTIAWLSLPL